jgi:hypothetical protein
LQALQRIRQTNQIKYQPYLIQSREGALQGLLKDLKSVAKLPK